MIRPCEDQRLRFAAGNDSYIGVIIIIWCASVNVTRINQTFERCSIDFALKNMTVTSEAGSQKKKNLPLRRYRSYYVTYSNTSSVSHSGC